MPDTPNHSLLRGTCLAALLGLGSFGVHGMDAAQGMVDEPCPPPLVMPPEAATLLSELFLDPHPLKPADLARLGQNEQFAAYEKEARRRGSGDWAGLCRFRRSNVAVMASATRPRVVFMGDSITENWGLADSGFFGAGVINRGISAQTSAQMLLRFRADVVALRPAIVHILAGTNDVAGNNGPTSPQEFRDNIESMVELAQAHGIRVILGSILPAAEFSWRPAMRPGPRIRALNEWLRVYAASHGLGYVDYHAAMAGPAGELRADLANEGVHPNRNGYLIMRRLAEAALAAQPPR